MADIEQLDKAIIVHTEWKRRLRKAVESRTFDVPVETVRLDNQCDFGKWLHGPALSSSKKASRHHETVLQLHAGFHECAARVLELALAGKAAEAEGMMSFGGGEYTVASSRLVLAMVDWKKVSK